MIVSDQNPARRESRGISGFYRILAIALAILFAGIAAASLVIWVKNAQYAYLLQWLNLLWLAYAAACAALLYGFHARKHIVALLFAMALLPRLALAAWHTYTPTNDFYNYWAIGQAFLQGDSAYIAGIVDLYRDYGFAALAVLEGAAQAISGSSLFGFQCLMAVVTSLIAVCMYFLGKRFSRNAGILAAMLYALYPSNMVMTQVFTNQHFATLFALLALLAFLSGLRAKTLRGNILYGMLAGALLLVSEYAHSSSLVTQAALAVYTAVLCIEHRKDGKRILAMVCMLAACLLTLYLVQAGINRLLLEQQYRLASTERFSYLEYVYTGLGDALDGQLDTQERIAFILMTPEEANAAILARIQNPVQLIKLFARKVIRMWGSMDSSFLWYTDGDNATRVSSSVAAAFGSLDMLFTAGVYALAAFGWVKARGDMRRLGLPLLLLAGWICAYMIIEIQPRYRYFGMTLVMLYAAVGGCHVCSRFRRFQNCGGCDIL